MLSVNLIAESAFTIRGHGVHTAYMEDLFALQRSANVVLSTNRPCRVDIQHAHTVGPYAMATLAAGRLRAVTAHLSPGSLQGSLRGDRTWHVAFLRYLRAFYSRADAVLAVSSFQAEELQRMGVTAPVHVVPNTVNVAAIRAQVRSRPISRTSLGVPADRPVIVGVGQLQPRKDIHAFVRCARALSQFSFYWVGGVIFGPLAADRAEMRRVVAGAPRNVHFVGQVSRRQVLAYLAAADLFFLPSRQENCPIAVLEAAAVGLPILLRDLPEYKAQFGGACAYGTDETFAELVWHYVSSQQASDELTQRSSVIACGFDAARKASHLLEIYHHLAF